MTEPEFDQPPSRPQTSKESPVSDASPEAILDESRAIAELEAAVLAPVRPFLHILLPLFWWYARAIL